MIDRLCKPLLSRSFFLFGARGTGKTTLLRELFPSDTALRINLLLPSDYDEFALSPETLIARVKALPATCKWVVIDEVQKLPRLLDIVHHLIEETDLKFALTGSSARKLKRKGVNLLAGRASVYHLFPFSSQELGNSFSLQETLEWGSLPPVINASSREERQEFLQAYVHAYLKQEIAEEQVVRQLEPFRRFLSVASQSNTKLINYKKIAQDVGTSAVTVKTYFSILEDTLIGFLLEPFHESVRKSQRQCPKFYFFDTGVERALSRSLDVPLREGTYAYGGAFETFFINEVVKMKNYLRKDYSLSYLRTKDDAEIDLIVERSPGDRILIEIKSTARVQQADCKNLNALATAITHRKALLISRDANAKQFDAVTAVPWQTGLVEIFE
jgi:predicted AAA+ superfamily ATPase